MTKPPTKILIVDDDVPTLKIIGQYLQQHGFEVAVLSDGYGVLSYCRQFKPDLVLLDILMPYVKGNELMVKLNEVLPLQRVVAMSASSDYREILFELGAKAYLVKPIDLEQLLKTINTVLQE